MKIGVLWIALCAACFSEAGDMRTWTLADGRSFEAKYVSIVANNVIMEGTGGKQKKIALKRFSPSDIEFFELENPPEFRISIRKKSSKLNYSDRFILTDMPVVLLYTFGARIEQRSAGEYQHEVTLEYFAVAAQRGANNKFILVDRMSSSFVPSKENNYSHEFWNPKTARLDEYSIRGMASRGKKYEGYLILVTDKNGKVIATKYSDKWLLENLENLRNLSVGNFMDTTCTRVYPQRPTEAETTRRNA